MHATVRPTVCLLLFACMPHYSDLAVGNEPEYRKLVQSHVDQIVRRSVDKYGPETTDMWLATIDTITGRLPEQALPRELRWYRKITSPNGSNSTSPTSAWRSTARPASPGRGPLAIKVTGGSPDLI